MGFMQTMNNFLVFRTYSNFMPEFNKSTFLPVYTEASQEAYSDFPYNVNVNSATAQLNNSLAIIVNETLSFTSTSSPNPNSSSTSMIPTSSHHHGDFNQGTYHKGINDSFGFTSEPVQSSSAACVGSDERVLLIAFLVQGLALTIVSTLGLLGNILSVITFARMKKKVSFTCLLLFLTFCDSVLILTSIFIFGLNSIFVYLNVAEIYTSVLYPILVYYLYPIALTAQTGSVYFTCCLTLERCFAVCSPLKSRKSLWTTWKRGLFISLLILLFAFLYNIPRWYEYRVVVSKDGKSLEIATTALRENPDFLEYYIHYGYFIVMYAVPMVMLIVVNSVIYRQIRRTNRARQDLSASQSMDNNRALILFGVVVVFLLCNALPLVNNVMELYYQCVSTILVNWANFLVSLNSSINFIIYYVIGERFRRYFRETICLKICCCCWLFSGKGGPGEIRRTSSSSGEMWSITTITNASTRSRVNLHRDHRRRTIHTIPGTPPRVSCISRSTHSSINNNKINILSDPNYRRHSSYTMNRKT